MDSILDDWGFSRIEHSQSMNEFSSYFDQPLRSTPAAKRYAPGKRLLQPLLDTNISADDITPSEYSTGIISAFNANCVIFDENMFDNAISSSMASNIENNDGPSENDVEGTSGEYVDSILFSTALSNEEDVQPRHDAEEEDSNDEEILATAIMSSSDEEEHLQTALQVETFNDDISGDDFVGPGETSDNENEGAPKSESDVIAADDTAVEPTVTFPEDSEEEETAKVDGGGPNDPYKSDDLNSLMFKFNSNQMPIHPQYLCYG